jgi:hypothetical protein
MAGPFCVTTSDRGSFCQFVHNPAMGASSACGRNAASRWDGHIPERSSDERVSVAKLAELVYEAAAAKNGWKRMLARCASATRGVS